MITRTEFITFPKSGHTLLIRILQRYFGPDLHYCERYMNPELMFDINQVTNCQKNHDFDLKTEIVPNRNYVVQIRDPLESIQSWREDQCLSGHPSFRKDFFSQQLLFWNRFVEKWVLGDVPNRLVIHYRELIDKPFSTVWNVIEHISGSVMNEERLLTVVEGCAVQSYRGLRQGTIM